MDEKTMTTLDKVVKTLEVNQFLSSSLSWVKYVPWERYSDYCDEQGRCWFQQYGKWILARPGTVENTVACLPACVNPPPQVKEFNGPLDNTH